MSTWFYLVLWDSLTSDLWFPRVIGSAFLCLDPVLHLRLDSFSTDVIYVLVWRSTGTSVVVLKPVWLLVLPTWSRWCQCCCFVLVLIKFGFICWLMCPSAFLGPKHTTGTESEHPVQPTGQNPQYPWLIISVRADGCPGREPRVWRLHKVNN